MDKPTLPDVFKDPALSQAAWSFAATWGLAGLGRLLWHLEQVRKGHRRFWSLHLIWEALTALSIGFVAEGVADWLGLTGRPALAVVIIVSYFGPRGIEEFGRRLAAKYSLPPAGKDGEGK